MNNQINTKSMDMIKKYFLLMMALLMLAVSCKEPEEEIVPEIKVPAASQEVFTSGIQFEATEDSAQPGQTTEPKVQTTQVQFTATDKWTADVIETKASSWLSVQPSSGNAGDVTMKVIAQPNTGLSPRSASVNIKCGNITKSFTVSQAGYVPPVVEVTGITLNQDELALVEGETATLTATVKPDDAADKTVTWSTSDDKVATVQDGTVTAIAEGKATITAAAGAFSAACEVTVAKKIIHVTSIDLSPTSLRLAIGESDFLVVRVLPDDATDKTYAWASTNSALAEVDAAGKVVAKAVGTVTITATTTDGGLMAGCEVTVYNPVIDVTSVALDKSDLVLEEGDTFTLTATVKPDDATDKTVVWSSSDATVASVQDGVVTAIKEGTTTITAAAGAFSATCQVTVNKKYIVVQSIVLDRNTLALVKGSNATLTATVSPSDATDPDVTWTSSNESVAKVVNGVVAALGSGTATITATAENQVATCEVTVTNPAKSIALDNYLLMLIEGDVATLVATVTPSDADELPVVWKSSDSSVATVDDNGNVTAIAPGDARITASCGNCWATCTVSVASSVIHVTDIYLDNNQLTLIKGDKATLAATVMPANATFQDVIWTSSDESVAKVVNGVVTAISSGTATIAASADGQDAFCEVTVTNPAKGIALDTYLLMLTEGDVATLVATVTPSDADELPVAWNSSNPAVATVDNSGKVTAIAPGEARITASCGNCTATCTVSVAARVIPVTSITLDKSSLSLLEGDSVYLNADVSPANATDRTVSWSSSASNIASVDAFGEVTAHSEGTATITATCGGFTATCAVTVAKMVIPVTSVTLDNASAGLKEGETVTLTATVAPDNATDKTVTWSSSNTAVATVVDGVVTAVKAGTATITAACGNFSATCEVTVEAAFVPVSSISLSKTELSMLEGEWYTLTVTFNPSNATDKTVNWSTSNALVAKLIAPGKIEAGKPGTAVITAECGGKIATCTVTVKDPPVAVTGISIPDRIEFYVGETVTIDIAFTPENAEPDRTASWRWYGEEYATSQKGDYSITLTGVAPGAAWLYVDCCGFSAACEVYVRERPVQRTVTVNPTSMTIDPGEEFVLNVTVDPPLGSGQKLEFYSSDTEVAMVDVFEGDGFARNPGTCRIEVRCPGAEKVYCDVTVTDHYDVSYFIINPTLFYVAKGATYAMEWSIYPEGASNTPISWSSSDPAIATIDASGVITGISLGTVTITAVCGGKTATSEVTIYEGGGGEEPPIDDPFRLDKDEITLHPGETYTLTVTQYPEGYGPDDLFWGSDNWDVATVEDGVVTAHKTGVANLVARVGEYEVYCQVKVLAAGGNSGGLDPVTDEPLN